MPCSPATASACSKRWSSPAADGRAAGPGTGGPREPLIYRPVHPWEVEYGASGAGSCLPEPLSTPPRPWFGASQAVSGRLTPGRHPIRATARARISQFAEANKTLRWLRFFAIPR